MQIGGRSGDRIGGCRTCKDRLQVAPAAESPAAREVRAWRSESLISVATVYPQSRPIGESGQHGDVSPRDAEDAALSQSLLPPACSQPCPAGLPFPKPPAGAGKPPVLARRLPANWSSIRHRNSRRGTACATHFERHGQPLDVRFKPAPPPTESRLGAPLSVAAPWTVSPAIPLASPNRNVAYGRPPSSRHDLLPARVL